MPAIHRKNLFNLNTLTGKSVASLAISVGGMACAFGLQTLMARFLGPIEFGVYAYLLSLTNIASMFCRFGLEVSALKLLPHYEATQEWSLAKGFIVRAIQAVLLFSIICSIAALILNRLIPSLLPHITESLLLSACVLLIANSLSVLLGSYLQAFGKVVFSQLMQNITKPALISLVCATVFINLGVTRTAQSGILISSFIALLLLLPMWKINKKNIPKKIQLESGKFSSLHWMRESLPMLMITGFNVMLYEADIVIVGSLLEPEQAGMYAAASRLSLLMMFVITVLNSIFSPKVSSLYSQGDHQRLQKMASSFAWANLLLSLPTFLVLIFFSEWLLGLYGAPFRTASKTLQILTISRFIGSSFGLSGYLMSMTGHQLQAAKIMAISAILNIGMNLCLVPIIGIIGAAYASLAAMIVSSILMTINAYNYTGINPTFLSFISRPFNSKQTNDY